MNLKQHKIVINDTISILDSESDGFCHSNLDGLESESPTIWFGKPNHLSLVCGYTSKVNSGSQPLKSN